MSCLIKSVEPFSPAAKKNISAGDRLLRVNGHIITDILDYKFYTYDRILMLELITVGNMHRFVKLKKEEGEELGLEFDTYLIDEPKGCRNHCVFCFVDQLPKGMRKTLYFKDDDARLSFLQGNYITLSNLSNEEMERIAELHVSPINVSVHATQPELRCRLLGNPAAGNIKEKMRFLADAGIIMNCQIVCCPGWNDGEMLLQTMRELTEYYPNVPSVSIVPVGLTGHRDKLTPLLPFNKEKARHTLDMVISYGDKCQIRFGSRIFFPADELFLKAERPLPTDEWYEDYPQLENGVGLLRLLISEFDSCYRSYEPDDTSFTAVTGCAAAPFITELLNKYRNEYSKVKGNVIPIINDFFGHTIDVAGLVTGGDILTQLRGKNLGERLLIPRNMLRSGETVFLDDVTLQDVEDMLSVKVRVVEQDGTDLAKAFSGR